MSIVVVGAGPAGLSAAIAASRNGARGTLVDDNASPGGQIWRGEDKGWRDQLLKAGVAYIGESRVVSASPGELLIENQERVFTLPFQGLVLATGARELFLPFPGWTLPSVMGAGGLQALVKSGLDISGRRVVVAGSGPLLLAVAAFLRKRGAHILLIAEQAPWSKLLRFTTKLPFRKYREALQLWTTTYSPHAWVTAAHGQGRLEQVTLTNGSRNWTIDCDYLAVGFGLTPNTELPSLMQSDPTHLDEFQQTGTAGIYCAGEVTGIGGADLAIVQGTIAGYAAAGQSDEARKHFPARARWQVFARALNDAFALRPELRQLPRPQTLVCRCEDVRFSDLLNHQSWRAAKLQTRCGMGPCQGRVCGPATQFLFGWHPDSVRPPLFPARASSFITASLEPQEGTQ